MDGCPSGDKTLSVTECYPFQFQDETNSNLIFRLYVGGFVVM